VITIKYLWGFRKAKVETEKIGLSKQAIFLVVSSTSMPHSGEVGFQHSLDINYKSIILSLLKEKSNPQSPV